MKPSLFAKIIITALQLHNNYFTGPPPAELSRLGNLTSLSLGFNSLSGSIPSELGSMSSLVGLFLEGNELSGTIPSQLAGLAGTMRQLEIDRNFLTGTVHQKKFLCYWSDAPGLPHFSRSTHPRTPGASRAFSADGRRDLSPRDQRAHRLPPRGPWRWHGACRLV